MNFARATETERWAHGDDLASVACRAAIEVDNLLLDGGEELTGVSELIRAIFESVTEVDTPALPNSLLDPTTATALNQAIQTTYPTQALKRLDDLVKEAARITQRLTELVQDPTRFRTNNRDELIQMRTFCLALSRSVSALIRPPQAFRPEHPLRR